ncbi:MAG: serine hydrolase [Bryobacterales bacterium]|nr:serine hydrolase [Bryobacterales bacterium]
MQIFILLTLLARGAAGADQAAIDRAAEATLRRLKAPGLVVVVVEGERVTHAKGYGVASVETREPVGPDHLFRVGSTTKMFVGAGVLRLAEQGKLSLRTPVGSYLSELPGPLADLTAHQLLTHTAGLMDRTLMYGAHDDTALAANIRGLQPDVLFAKPGEIYSYSNLGYAMAGRLIEVAAMKPFADAMSGLLFVPLGMKRTTFRPTMAMTYPMAQGHIVQQGETVVARPAADHSGYWPAGSMFTSGNDFARWAVAVMNGGRIEGRQVVEAEVVRSLTMPHVSTPSGGQYGYGVSVQMLDGVEAYSHGGSRLGYGSFFLWCPQKKTGVITLANLSGADTGPLAREIFTLATAMRSQPDTRKPLAEMDLSKLTGLYAQYTSYVRIALEGGELRMTADGRTTVLKQTGGTCFTGGVCFTLDGSGRGIYVSRGSRGYARR